MSQTNLPFNKIAQEVSTRNNVFAVLFCFLFSIAPHFRHLPLWVSGFVLVALSWRSLQNIGKLKEIPKWLLVPMVLFGGIGVFAEYWTVVGRDAGLALLTVMASFKFLESRNHRDMLILIFLCYFLIATHFLFSQTIPTALMMLVTFHLKVERYYLVIGHQHSCKHNNLVQYQACGLHLDPYYLMASVRSSVANQLYLQFEYFLLLLHHHCRSSPPS